MTATHTLQGRVFIQTSIEVVTGLIIGGSDTGLEIGGVDKVLIRNPLTKQPYIPGSSLRGKMRSQLEKTKGLLQNKGIGSNVKIHTCQKAEDYNTCDVCHIFGVPGEMPFSAPTRLIVRDVQLDLVSDKGKKVWDKAKPDLLYAELKTEVAIDRVTSAATPRTIERVPAGAIFGPAELVFSLYGQADYDRLKVVIEAMQLVEDDYLGGSGSRGSGKIQFADIAVFARARQDYSTSHDFKKFDDVRSLAAAFDNLKTWMQATIPMN